MTQLALAGTSGFILPPDADPDRDCWCTPKWLTDLLPLVDLDPCSNPRSTVISKVNYSREANQDGLALPWSGSVFCNPPYSDVWPWSMKALSEHLAITGIGWLVNADPSTAWWRSITRRCNHVLLFHKRVQFTPPPGVEPSTNNKPQALLMDDGFLAMCMSDLLVCGTLWSHAKGAM
jgi:hypothetical protein